METRDLAIVAQWEIAQILHRAYEDCLSVKPPSDGTYLDTEAVWGAAKVAFEPFGITEVIPVAQPFLHLRKIKKLMERDGYTVVDRHVGHIGFDRKSSQWWTRGYLQLIIYAILQTLTGLKGHRGKQSD
jgi:hypothetical protein